MKKDKNDKNDKNTNKTIVLFTKAALLLFITASVLIWLDHWLSASSIEITEPFQGIKPHNQASKDTVYDVAYFRAALPSTEIASVNKTDFALNPLYQLTTYNDKHLFITQDRRYVLIGEVMDLKTGEFMNYDAKNLKVKG
jgi:hypothetical protein